MQSTCTIPVLLADDHAVVREGLRVLLSIEPDINVVGEAEDGRQAIKLARLFRPRIVVMDISMPLLDGIEATCLLTRNLKETRILILSSSSDDVSITAAIKAGASGYLLKQSAASDLLHAIRELDRGNAYFSPLIAQRLRNRCTAALRGNLDPLHNGKSDLTPREAQVLQLIAKGRPSKAIGSELDISAKTVEKHRQQVMDKLGIHDVAGLTRYASANGFALTRASA